MKKEKSRVLAVLGFLLICVFSAQAYQFQHADEAGKSRLRWKSKSITVAVSASFAPQNPHLKLDGDVAGAIRRSFAAWENSGGFKFQLIETDKTAVSQTGKAGDGISLLTNAPTPENLLLFSGEASEQAALTRVFFNRHGLITEADIVLNPYAQFSTDGNVGTFDLEAVLTHEIGHLLGLAHSSVPGATMYAGQPKNGVYNLSALGPRTLALDDQTAVNALYGPGQEETECCAAIAGKLSGAKKNPTTGFEIIAEHPETGQTVAAVLSDAAGNFRIEGLRKGNYRLLARPRDGEGFATVEIGEISAENNKPVGRNFAIVPQPTGHKFSFIGFNGQIADLAVSLNKGKSYTVYLAGKDFPQKLDIGFTSPYFSVVPESVMKHDYGQDLSVISAEVLVSTDAREGEYSLFIETENKVRNFYIGGLVIDRVANPWFNLSNEIK